MNIGNKKIKIGIIIFQIFIFLLSVTSIIFSINIFKKCQIDTQEYIDTTLMLLSGVFVLFFVILFLILDIVRILKK